MIILITMLSMALVVLLPVIGILGAVHMARRVRVEREALRAKLQLDAEAHLWALRMLAAERNGEPLPAPLFPAEPRLTGKTVVKRIVGWIALGVIIAMIVYHPR
jgi:hypothetical protein